MNELKFMLPGLYALSSKGMKLDLERPRAGMELLGNPQRDFPCVLITGTNGKGSTAAFLEAILQEAGYKTGLFTSPHLVRYNERVRINGREIEDAEIERLLKSVGEAIHFDFAVGKATDEKQYLPLTFFEVTTAMALLAFKEAKVDIAILEIGLGGRLDATNVCDPIMTLITTIGYDHTSILGDTLEQIAAEKAATMRKSRPAIFGWIEGEALATLKQKANEIGADYFMTGDYFNIEDSGESFTLSLEGERISGLRPCLNGDYQLQNAAQAALAALMLKRENGFSKVTEAAVKRGLLKTRWRARAEWFEGDPPLIIDSSHNKEGIRSFIAHYERIARERGIKKAGLIFASTRAGFLSEVLEMLSPYFCDLVCTQSSSDRSVLAEDICAVARRYFKNSSVAGGVKGAYELIRQRNPDLDLIVFTGSLYLAGNALAMLEDPEALENPFPNA